MCNNSGTESLEKQTDHQVVFFKCHEGLAEALPPSQMKCRDLLPHFHQICSGPLTSSAQD